MQLNTIAHQVTVFVNKSAVINRTELQPMQADKHRLKMQVQHFLTAAPETLHNSQAAASDIYAKL